MLTSPSGLLSRFFLAREETDQSLAGMADDQTALSDAYRAVMVSDGTLTNMLSAVHMEEIATDCELSGEAFPEQEHRQWLNIGPDVGPAGCHWRQVVLRGELSGTAYVRALSHLYTPRLPDSFLEEMSRPGSSLGTQLIRSRISTRREMIWIRSKSGCFFTRLYRILINDRPGILIQEDFLR